MAEERPPVYVKPPRSERSDKRAAKKEPSPFTKSEERKFLTTRDTRRDEHG